MGRRNLKPTALSSRASTSRVFKARIGAPLHKRTTGRDQFAARSEVSDEAPLTLRTEIARDKLDDRSSRVLVVFCHPYTRDLVTDRSRGPHRSPEL